MRMAVILKHLDKTESGRWRYRRRFPKVVQELVGAEWFRRVLRSKTEADLLREYPSVAADFDKMVKDAEAKTRSGWDGLSPREAWEAGKREAEALVASVIGLNHVHDDDTDDAANQIAEASADYERRSVVAESLAKVKGKEWTIKALYAPDAAPPAHTLQDARALYLKERLNGGDGVDAALSPPASKCAKLVMLKSQEKREGIHEGN